MYILVKNIKKRKEVKKKKKNEKRNITHTNTLK